MSGDAEIHCGASSGTSEANAITDNIDWREYKLQDQGLHECEIWTSDFEGERGYTKCKKNPSHEKFIPAKEFSIDHLPEPFKDEELVEYVRLMCERTVRIVVKYTSPERPRHFPFYKVRGQYIPHTGTGIVYCYEYPEFIETGDGNGDNYYNKDDDDDTVVKASDSSGDELQTSKKNEELNVQSGDGNVKTQERENDTNDDDKKVGTGDSNVVELDSKKNEELHLKPEDVNVGTQEKENDDNDDKKVGTGNSNVEELDSQKNEELHVQPEDVNVGTQVRESDDNNDDKKVGTSNSNVEELDSQKNEELHVQPEELNVETREGDNDDEADKKVETKDFKVEELDTSKSNMEFNKKLEDMNVGTQENRNNYDDAADDDGSGDDEYGDSDDDDDVKIYEYFDLNLSPCPCFECKQSDRPRQGWGYVYVFTAKHVVYDKVEAQNTTIELNVDDSGDKDSVKRLYGIDATWVDDREEWVSVECVTHDRDLWIQLYESWKYFSDLKDTVHEKYWESPSRLCLVVSHPHGWTKKVTVGEWIERNVLQVDGNGDELSEYVYDTATCRGSSGSPVLLLGRRNTQAGCRTWVAHHHVHSRCRGKDRNSSGVESERNAEPDD